MVGKQHREPISKIAKWKAHMKLELIHSDVCGPINPQSNGGNRYFITFTDDFGRRNWIYFLQDKASAFETFKRFTAAVERESGCRMVCNPIVPDNRLSKDDSGKKFNATNFKQMIGFLMYLLATRLDLAYVVCLIARYMERPTEIHFAAAKRILRYLKGSLQYGILYKTG